MTILGCVALSASDGQAGDIAAVLKQFPGYHVLTLEERDPSLKAYIAQHFPKANASVVRADFNGDGNQDYALLLKDDKTGAAKLVVLLCSADGQCKSVYDVDETTYASVAYLRPVSTGSKAGGPAFRAFWRVAQPFAFFAKAGDVHSSHQVVVRWRNLSQCLGD
jgi:hypothetical protein